MQPHFPTIKARTDSGIYSAVRLPYDASIGLVSAACRSIAERDESECRLADTINENNQLFSVRTCVRFYFHSWGAFLSQVFAVYALMSFLESVTDSLILRSVFIVLYWAAQGTLFFALFVDGHDCGHGSFSRYPLLNDIVGTITHGFLMVPFYQWKLSHQHHHKYTGNMDRDEVFYPVRRSQQTPGGRLLPGFALGFGWLIYLSVG
jgi:Fatty acid desaturase